MISCWPPKTEDNVSNDRRLCYITRAYSGATTMSRGKIGLLFFCYLIAAFGFAAVEAWQDSFWTPNATSIGRVAGEGLAVYVLAAVLPMIGWAFVKFRAESAGGPFLFWLLLGVGLAYLSQVGTSYDRAQKIANMAPNGVFTGKDRNDFIRSVNLSCAQNQRMNPLTSKLGLSEVKIVAYCDCYAAGMAAAITPEELRTIATTGRQPVSIVEKSTTLGNLCSQ
jgi:hypothetical protein